VERIQKEEKETYDDSSVGVERVMRLSGTEDLRRVNIHTAEVRPVVPAVTKHVRFRVEK
jgi:hypothetical protein